MPEMTPERIASLAQSAKERDPNPGPLDAPNPEREPVPMRATVSLIGPRDIVIAGDDLTSFHDEIGNLAIEARGDVVALFSRGQWSSCVFEEIGDDDGPDAVEESGRVLTDADVSAIAEALSPGFSDKIWPEGGLR